MPAKRYHMTETQYELLRCRWPELKIDRTMEVLCNNTLWGGDCYGSTRCNNDSVPIKLGGPYKLSNGKKCDHDNFQCKTCHFTVCNCCYEINCPLCGPPSSLNCWKHTTQTAKYIECQICGSLLCGSCETPCVYCLE